MDTIFAEATAPGRAGVAVVRVSGPEAVKSLYRLTGRGVKARQAELRTLTSKDGDVLDQALVLQFFAPASFTGEDVVEYHLHGSVAVVAAVQAELGRIPGYRQAEPGEFTRRALANGKMDLTQVEGLADLIEAQTELQRRQAQQTVSGAFTQFVEMTRADLIRAAALLEASMDFADEEIPDDVSLEVCDLLARVETLLSEQIGGHRFAERLRAGFEVAIIGPPNAGKSTLLNMMAGREASITSRHAGTTRDVIEVHMDMDGIPVTLLDTAGLRETEDEVEELGVARAIARANDADLRVLLTDGDLCPEVALNAHDISVMSKADLSNGTSKLAVSGLTGAGVDRLIGEIGDRLKNRVQRASLATRQRHVDELNRALDAVRSAKLLVESGSESFDLAAEDMRNARHALARMLGHVDVESLLDVIFSSFCVGK